MQMQPLVAADHILSAELRRSEKLLWSGRPRQGVFLTQNDAGMIPFSLMWGGFSFFWEYQAVNSRAPLFVDLWGVRVPRCLAFRTCHSHVATSCQIHDSRAGARVITRKSRNAPPGPASTTVSSMLNGAVAARIQM